MKKRVNQVHRTPYEVFSEVEKLASFHDRVEFLKANETFSVKTILQCNFLPSIILDLPEGAPPFRRDPMPPDMAKSRIDKSIKILGKLALAPGQRPAHGLAKLKKERSFISLLEAVSEHDADVIIAAKDKELTKLYPMIDATLAKTAFPTLFP
jgi:hypothetical protein